jgi:hypothetical protein
MARRVAALLAVLDLDHLGAEIGEQHRAEGARAELLDEGEDPQPASGISALPSTSCFGR